MRTEKQLLEQLRELRTIVNALPHPDYHSTKEIASSPRIRVFAQIKAVLDELKQNFGYEEPEPEHPVKWVNDLFQRLGVKYTSHNVSIRGTVLSNGTYISVEYVRVADQVYYEDGQILDLDSRPTEESRALSQVEADRLRAAAEEMDRKNQAIYPSHTEKDALDG